MPEKNEEHQSVFRQSSIDRISSPEKKDDYLRLPSPGLILVVLAPVILAAGAVYWMLFGI